MSLSKLIFNSFDFSLNSIDHFLFLFCAGFGLFGPLVLTDVIHAQVIDENEWKWK